MRKLFPAVAEGSIEASGGYSLIAKSCDRRVGSSHVGLAGRRSHH